jgi:hypothetical protein
MAITNNDAKMFWEAYLRGVSFHDTVTVGHLRLFLHPAEMRFFQKAHHVKFPDAKMLTNYEFGAYSDEFLREVLGVHSLTILDYSSYEGASLLHDLNQPVPENLWGAFDAVIDAGTLEHVFNFPVAIANLMKMVKVGGSIFVTTVANNLCGHGFYQFSPELMYRIFSRDNGFQLQHVKLFEAKYPMIELTPNRKVYEVADPAQVQSRVGLVSRRPIMMMVEAKKREDCPLFVHPVLQSDYVATWNQADPKLKRPAIKKMLRNFSEKLPLSLRFKPKGYLRLKQYSFSNSQFYTKR